MRRSDFHYDLPDALIARYPPAQRSGGRLLHLDGRSGEFQDRNVVDLPGLLRPGDLLVFNDTRVVPARLVMSGSGLSLAIVPTTRLAPATSYRVEVSASAAFARPSRACACCACRRPPV